MSNDIANLQVDAIENDIQLPTWLLYEILQALNGGGGDDNVLLSISNAVEQILNTINVTNNLVSVVEFAYDEVDPGNPSTAFAKYNQWLTDNPDWHVINEITYPNPSTDETINGTPVIMVRFTGQKSSE